MRVALNGLFLAAPDTGTGQYLRELVREMVRLAAHDEFTLIAPVADPSAPAGVLVAPTLSKTENLGKLEFEQLTFPRACRRGRFHLAHVPHFGPPLRSSVPTVVTIHDLIPLRLPAYRGSPGVQLYTKLAAVAARRARLIFTDSETSARDIQLLLDIPRERIRVVYLAADSRFAPVKDIAELARMRAKYQLPERFILYLGGFDVRKNVGCMIEAFSGLEAERANGWRLVLAGQLPTKHSAFFPDPQQTAKEFGVHNDTQFIGYISEEDKPALVSAASIFVYPSRYEGFGLPPLEALACGTPVLAANSASLPEVIGDAGILLDPDDARAWSEALHTLINDPARYRDLQGAGPAQARKFSWTRTAQKTLEAYRSVAHAYALGS